MWLRLNLEGIDFHFRISKYRNSTRENWDDEWCEIDLTLQSQEWLNYQIVSDEAMLAAEVEDVRDKNNDLLHDNLDKPKKIDSLGPDLPYKLKPKETNLNTHDLFF